MRRTWGGVSAVVEHGRARGGGGVTGYEGDGDGRWC